MNSLSHHLNWQTLPKGVPFSLRNKERTLSSNMPLRCVHKTDFQFHTGRDDVCEMGRMIYHHEMTASPEFAISTWIFFSKPDRSCSLLTIFQSLLLLSAKSMSTILKASTCMLLLDLFAHVHGLRMPSGIKFFLSLR